MPQESLAEQVKKVEMSRDVLDFENSVLRAENRNLGKLAQQLTEEKKKADEEVKEVKERNARQYTLLSQQEETVRALNQRINAQALLRDVLKDQNAKLQKRFDIQTQTILSIDSKLTAVVAENVEMDRQGRKLRAEYEDLKKRFANLQQNYRELTNTPGVMEASINHLLNEELDKAILKSFAIPPSFFGKVAS